MALFNDDFSVKSKLQLEHFRKMAM